MKKILVILLALALVFAFAACGNQNANTEPAPVDEPADTPETETVADDDWSTIQAKGKLVIGITEYEPMNYYDADGTLIGFDTEFAEAVCAALGVEPEFVVIDWDNKELELSSGNIDCIWNGLTVTEERRENMDFSVSYLENKQSAVIRVADAGTYVDAASLAGAASVAESGSAGETAILTDLADTEYTAVLAQTDALLELKSGAADVAVIDYTMATAMTGEGTDYADLTILDAIEMTPEEYAIGFRLGSTTTAEVNAVIASLQADGTLSALADKYDLADLLIK